MGGGIRLDVWSTAILLASQTTTALRTIRLSTDEVDCLVCSGQTRQFCGPANPSQTQSGTWAVVASQQMTFGR
jgi:3-oxoacyl-[acyl-carrier-protein] synthase III